MNQPIHDELQKTCAMIADATGGLVMIAIPTIGVTVAATPSSGTPIVEAAMGFCMIEDVLCDRIKHAREAYTAHGGTADEFDRILARTREKIGLDPDRGSFLSRSWVRPDATRGGGHGSGEGAPS